MGKSGFTLIELMIVISITGILVGLGVANYNNFNKRQAVKGAALTLKNNLRFAQNKALAGEKPASGCDVLDGYKVEFVEDIWYPLAASYSLGAKCSPTSPPSIRSFPFGSFPLPNQIYVQPVPFPNPIVFKVLGQGVQGISTSQPIVICLKGFNLIYKLSVTVTGEIKDEGFVSVCH